MLQYLIVGVIVLLLGATGVFAELQNDLDRIWRSPTAQRKEGIWAMIRGRLLCSKASRTQPRKASASLPKPIRRKANTV